MVLPTMIPPETLRLFAHFEEAPDLGSHESAIIERVFEDGDRDDLRWLTEEIPEQRLATWLTERGHRQLSNRSRAFWSLLLGVPTEPRRTEGSELWPL